MKKANAATSSGEPSASLWEPSQVTDNMLSTHLAEVQDRVRQIMRQFGIASASIYAMARQAELEIADATIRAEFLRLLIDLHGFGREASRRGILGQLRSSAGSGPSVDPVIGPVIGIDGDPPIASDGGTAPAIAGGQAAASATRTADANDKSSRSFFASLDRAPR